VNRAEPKATAAELATWAFEKAEQQDGAAKFYPDSPASENAPKLFAIAAELTRLVEVERALQRFREDRERLLARIEFAAQPIGNCGHCLVGNKPGEHHLPDCPAYRSALSSTKETGD